MINLHPLESVKLYNVARRLVKTLIKQTKWLYKGNITAESKNKPNIFLSTLINN